MNSNTNKQGFQILFRDRETQGRCGLLATSHGTVRTPAFMPVGTQATVKGMTPEELKELGVEILLCNTYHLHLRPGEEVIARLGGLHRFMNWQGPILTDSGGFQVFSLSPLRRISEEGVSFRSHLDGSEQFLSPEDAIRIQRYLGTDIAMCLDECIPFPSSYSYAQESTARTLRWARRCKEALGSEDDLLLFGIVQGGTFEDLRRRCAEELTGLEFPGYAIGGLSVGEPLEERFRVVESTIKHLPDNLPRYLMGVGTPEDLLTFVPLGVDMFDCVIPTRCARNGLVFTHFGKLDIRHAAHKHSEAPIDEKCGCYTCRHYSRAYLRHLHMAKEILSARLLTLHNLYYYMDLTARIREAIRQGRLRSFQEKFFRDRRPLEAQALRSRDTY